MSSDPVRLLAAGGVVLAYLLLCLTIAWRYRGRRARASLPQGLPHWMVAYASQTGAAEALAWQTANVLHRAGQAARVCSLAEVNADRLRRAERILFVVSTYGEGQPPDSAANFLRQLMVGDISLRQLHYAVLALGDDSYTHFCGFGRQLDADLQRRGAQALFARIDVNRGDGVAIAAWREQVSHLAGIADVPDWHTPSFVDWRLSERRLLNSGSVGGPVYHLEFEPVGSPLPSWSSGDLVQILAPADADRPREYSIASIPDDGRLHLLVRQHRLSNGRLGVASGWLTHELAPGGQLKLRLRAQRQFRLDTNVTRPLILIGNGTGLAGLRSHLKARIKAGMRRNWLIFGERNAACDALYQADIDDWQCSGALERVDWVFSRDQPQRRYVQDCLRDAGTSLHDWVAQGAAIYVCGSLQGMARGVDAALRDVLGEEQLQALSLAGRYRRDVY